MKTKIITCACLCAFGIVLAAIGYIRMAALNGPARAIATSTADTAMLMVAVGAILALLGAVLTVFAAIRSRA